MVVSQPYGDIAIVKKYCVSVGNISDTIYNNILARADNEVEAALGLDLNEHIDNLYVYYKKVQDICENWSACRVLRMFGRRDDAVDFCETAEMSLTELKAEDQSLQDIGDVGTMEHPPEKTFPYNPDGMKLQGRPSSGTGSDFF